MKLVYVLILIPLVSAELETLNIAERFAGANINALIDHYIPQISQFIIDHGLDPLKLPPTTKKLWMNLPQTSKYVEPVPYKADLSLHSGILKHLSDLKRYGDATMNYEDKLFKLNIGFEFKELEVLYNFAIKIFFVNCEGLILASTENVRAKFCVSYNISNKSLSLDDFDLQLPSRIKVTIKNKKGNVSHIKTFIVKLIIPFFKNTLVETIQKEGAKAIQMYLDKINKFLKKWETHNEIMNFINAHNEIMNQYSPILIS
ncbi:hypothetical protein ALC57_00291 [Trachymyrmex cornetzi]|uniref:Circadian clock-controlled protein n=1 Tax=Trachymyrmex cornetzi TaxID=471704 RepID=A0A151JSD2_9HYME|nr:hypothetical protein ALC57_00291 [Trachymyrmex cornetzi]